MTLDRDLIEAIRDLDEHDLRRLFILARARLESKGVPVEGAQAPSVRLRQRAIRCGKFGCTSCPHGPYWYAYWTENGKRRSKYVGKLLDE